MSLQHQHAPETDTASTPGGGAVASGGLAAQNLHGNQALLEQLNSSGEQDPEASIYNGIDSETPGVRAGTERYTVRRGDTLSGIARRAGHRGNWQELYNLNRDLILDPDELEIGWNLVLPEGWSLRGSVDDPDLLTGDPLALANTEYADPDIGMAVQVGADGSETTVEGHTAGAEVEGERKVRIVADFGGAIEFEGDGTPAEADLFVDDPAGQTIERQRGTVAAPTTFRTADHDDMFIDGRPHVEDVRQGGIGDCFEQADLLGIVNQDPDQIGRMMSYEGERATVELYREEGGVRVPTSVVVTNDLMVKSDDLDDLKGASLRLANAPSSTLWFAEIYGAQLEITKHEEFEWALWAPLLEKAYARFAEQYGKYGDAAAQPSGSGYDEINGGKARHVMPVFYGDQVTDKDADWIEFEPGDDIVAENRDNIETLLLFDENTDDTTGEQHFLSFKIGDEDALERCKALVEAVLDIHDPPWWGLFDTFGPALTDLKAALDTWDADRTDANRDVVITKATAVQAPGTHDELWDAAAEPVVGHLGENLGIVINIGSDNSPGRRMVYSSHQYNLKAIHWAFTSAPPTTLSSGTLDACLPFIDEVGTRLEIENPHARNEPDLDGSGPTDGANDGRFDMSLDSAFRNFSWLEATVVDHTATP